MNLGKMAEKSHTIT